ncbi:energy transducer TonB [Gemmatimonadota bacterium]
MDLQAAETLIASKYPLVLQRAGVGGSVKLMFWLNTEGVPESLQMREGSGYRTLNYAAMLAARELRFRPATRDGVPVGTWVEIVVHFVPGSGAGFMELDPMNRGGVGGY